MSLSWVSPILVLVGVIRAIWGLPFLMNIPAFKHFTASTFQNNVILEEEFLAASFAPWVTWVCLALLLISGTIAAVLLIIAIRGHRKRSNYVGSKMNGVHDYFTVPLLLVYAVFNTLWEPHNPEFWIALIPIGMLAIFRGVANGQGSVLRYMLCCFFVAALFLGNLLGAVLPQTSHKADYWYNAHSYLIRNTGPHDLVVTECGYIGTSYLRLYADCELLIASSVPATELPARMLRHGEGRVLISSWIFEPPPKLQPHLRASGGARNRGAVLAALDSLRSRMIPIDDNGYQVILELQQQ